MMDAVCLVSNCIRPARAHGWCQAHCLRWRRHGDPLAGRTANGEPRRFLDEVVLAWEGDECLTWPYYCGRGGYGHIKVGGRHTVVSRLVCEAVHGPPPTPEHEAAHLCGKGYLGCVAPAHLSWKTRTENHADKFVHGTDSRGERNGSAKLTEADVRAIRALEGTTNSRAIGTRFGVSRSAVNDILRHRSWAWL